MSEATTITSETLRQVLKQLVGKTAWRSKASSSTGSIFTLQFGTMLPGDKTQGEFSLMVYCAWRIVEADQILLSWHDDSDKVLSPGLGGLQEQTVTDIELSKWNDLTLYFTRGQALQIVNDFSPFHAFDDSWNINYNGQYYYSINPGNMINYEFIER
jgi:hypothetical protein